MLSEIVTIVPVGQKSQAQIKLVPAGERMALYFSRTWWQNNESTVCLKLNYRYVNNEAIAVRI